MSSPLATMLGWRSAAIGERQLLAREVMNPHRARRLLFSEAD